MINSAAATGDASGGSGGFGGSPAQVGFDAGNEDDFLALEVSFTADVLSVCENSNVGEIGVWRFAIREGEVFDCGVDDKCDIDTDGDGQLSMDEFLE